MRAFTVNHSHQWHSYLLWAKLCYNTTFHTAIGMIPYQALYGCNPKLLPTYSPGSAVVDEVDIELIDRKQLQSQLQHHITRA